MCGTVKAAGTYWASQVIAAARKFGRHRVFIVQMERDAYVEHLAADSKIARFGVDPDTAIAQLIEAIKSFYPQAPGLVTSLDAERRYRELTLASHDIIDLANLPEDDRHVASRQLDLRQLYVPLRLNVKTASETSSARESG